MATPEHSDSEANATSPSETPAVELRGKRRSRGDSSDRVFKCGCGKTYLSNPALYTHVKQKHDGNAPSGTCAPNSRMGKMRGRPKRTAGRSDAERPAGDEDVGFFERREYTGGPANPLEACGEFSELREAVLKLDGDRRTAVAPESPIRDVIASYLIDVSQRVKPASLRLFAEFLEALLACLNTHGFTLPGEQQDTSEPFTAVRTARQIPDIANSFITDFLETRRVSFGREEAVDIMMHLCRWLYSQRFTNLKLSLIDQRSDSEAIAVQLAESMREAQLPAFKDLVDQIKVLIKSKAEHPANKLTCLKVLNLCVIKGNPRLLTYVSKKMLSRLTIIAKFHREDPNPDRGASLFNSQTQEGMRASADFLQYLLAAIRKWAQMFGKNDDGTPSVFLKAYTQLQRDKVEFPPMEGARPLSERRSRPMPPVAAPPRVFSLEQCLEEILQFEERMTEVGFQSPVLREYASAIQTALRDLEKIIEEKANKGSDDDLESYFGALEMARGAVLRFDELPREKQKPPEPQKPVQKPANVPFGLPPQPLNASDPRRFADSPDFEHVPEDFPIPPINISEVPPLSLPEQPLHFNFDADLAIEEARPPPATERIANVGGFDFEQEWVDPMKFQQTLPVNRPEPEFKFEDEGLDIKEAPDELRESQLDEYLATIEKNEKVIEEKIAEVKAAKATIEQMRAKESDLSEQLQATSREVASLKAELKLAREKPAASGEELERLKAELETASQRAEKAAASSLHKREAAELMNSELGKKVTELNNKIQNEKMQFASQLREASIREAQAQAEISQLRQELSSLQFQLDSTKSQQDLSLSIESASSLSLFPAACRGNPSIDPQSPIDIYNFSMPQILSLSSACSISLPGIRKKTKLRLETLETISVSGASYSESTEAILSPILSPQSSAPTFLYETGPVSHMSNPFDSFPDPSSSDSSIIDLLTSSAFTTGPIEPEPANLDIFPKANSQTQGLLYSSSDIEAKFKCGERAGSLFCLHVLVGNKAMLPLVFRNLEVTENIVDGFTTTIEGFSLPVTIYSGSSVRFMVKTTASKAFIDSPKLKLTLADRPMVILKLPVTFFRFTDPLLTSPERIFPLLSSLSDQERTESFHGLHKRFRNLKDVGAELSLGGSLQVYSPAQVQGLDATSVVLCGSCFGKEICAKVTLLRDGSGGQVSVYSSSFKVRRESLSLLVSLLT